MKNMSLTTKLVIALLVAILVSTALSICTTSVRDAEAQVRPRVHRPSPIAFSFRAKRVPKNDFAGRAGSRVGICYYMDKQWAMTNPSGTIQYSPEFDVLWCQNKSATKIVNDRWSSRCLDGGGYYVFEGCSKSRTSFGFDFVKVAYDWKFSHTIYLFTNYKTPFVRMEIGMNGHVSGTLTWDRI